MDADMTSESAFHKDRTAKMQTQVVAFAVGVIACCLFSALLAASYFAESNGDCDVVLDGKINPNKASAASLARLPNIGPKRAEAIIEYREAVGSETPAFQRCADLEKIKGIGPKTVEKIGPWLCFE